MSQLGVIESRGTTPDERIGHMGKKDEAAKALKDAQAAGFRARVRPTAANRREYGEKLQKSIDKHSENGKDQRRK